jgi:flagellar biosynthesis protein FlhA
MVMLDTLDALTKVSDPERASANRRFLDEYIPGKVTPELLLSVIRLLLEERVSIRNLFLIIETLAEAKQSGANLQRSTELVRQRLAFQIVDRLQDEQGRLPLVQLSTAWEQKFAQYEITNENGGSDIALPPELFGELTNSVQTKLNEAAKRGVIASVATTSRRRRFLQTVLVSKGIRNAVLAYEEINAKTKPYIIGVV